tara:strand:+ start:909 stop:1118 length:210 start_codon:yes stop_codon:yes gene_type:complete
MKITQINRTSEYNEARKEALKERALEARLDNLYALANQGIAIVGQPPKPIEFEIEDVENELEEQINKRK